MVSTKHPSPLSSLSHLDGRGDLKPQQSAYSKNWGEGVVVTIVWTSILLVSASLLWLLFDIFHHGLPALSWNFLGSAPTHAGRAGGIAPMLASTLLILLVCLSVCLPLGLGTAMLLSEFVPQQNIFGRLVRRSLDVLAGVPSIVFGLFGNAFFCKTLGLGFSIVSGGLTLACMALPILIRSTEEGFRSVPGDYRSAAAALGLSKSSAILKVILPAAIPGLMVGTVLGIGRALAETAALIFTSGYVDRMPSSLLDSGRALSVHIYDLAMNVPGGDKNAYGSALILITLIVIINACATTVGSHYLKRRILTV